MSDRCRHHLGGRVLLAAHRAGGIPGQELALQGSWDLVITVIIRVATLILTYSPIRVLIAIFTMSHDPPSSQDSKCGLEASSATRT